MYTDVSSNDSYPKTLMIRNHDGGTVWQVYHVRSQAEADTLASNARGNGFYGSTLEDYQPEEEETWPDWRQNCGEPLKSALVLDSHEGIVIKPEFKHELDPYYSGEKTFLELEEDASIVSP